MGLFSRLRNAIAPETRDGGDGLGFGMGWNPLGFGGTLNAGMGGPVRPWMAENLATVTACVNAISSSIASLPAFVYKHDEAGRTEARSHPVARLVKRPNRHQTWPDWLEMMVSETLLWGNGISVISYDGAGRVTELIPVPFPFVQMSLLPSGQLVYDVVAYIAPWGGAGLPFGTTGAPRRYLEDEVFHLRDRSDNGFIGRSRLSRAPEMLHQAAALQDYSTSVWRNSATPSGALKTTQKLANEVREQLASQFSASQVGTRNAKKTIVLEQGLEWVPFSVSPEDAEVLASRRFTVEELCRLFNVPPTIIQDYTHASLTNAAQAGLFYATNSLLPWVRKIEAEFGRSVFGEGSPYALELDLSGLTRGDFSARWQAWSVAISSGILSVDEIRQIEGFNARPDAAEVVPGATDP